MPEVKTECKPYQQSGKQQTYCNSQGTNPPQETIATISRFVDVENLSYKRSPFPISFSNNGVLSSMLGIILQMMMSKKAKKKKGKKKRGWSETKCVWVEIEGPRN